MVRMMKDDEIVLRLKTDGLNPEDVEELCSLGFNLENGILYEKDNAKALALYRRAYEAGSAKGANNFGYLLAKLSTSTETTSMALSILEKAAALGNTTAMINIGNIYEFGQRTGKPEYKEAAKWYQRAALLGDGTGVFNYANLLHSGRGVRRDRETAFLLFEKLTKRGFKGAAFYLGLYYENGYVVNRDYKEALRYYQLGASTNDAFCYNQLGRMYCLGRGIQKPEPEMGFFYYEQAAKMGDATGLSNMAYAYEVGQGVKQDTIKAIEYYTQAAELGEENAIESLERLREEIMTSAKAAINRKVESNKTAKKPKSKEDDKKD